jgi:hypothetical protein
VSGPLYYLDNDDITPRYLSSQIFGSRINLKGTTGSGTRVQEVSLIGSDIDATFDAADNRYIYSLGRELDVGFGGSANAKTFLGQFNVRPTASERGGSGYDKVLTVGSGSNENNRQNALEISVGGSVYVPNITEADTESNFILQDSSTGELITLPDPPRAKYEGNAAFTFGGRSGNVGQASVTFGPTGFEANEASGDAAAVFGSGNVASGNLTLVQGEGTTVSGDSSAAFGDGSTVSGVLSFSLGQNNEVPGIISTAVGNGLTVRSPNSTAVGLDNEDYRGSNPSTTNSITADDRVFQVGAGDSLTGFSNFRGSLDALYVTYRNGTHIRHGLSVDAYNASLGQYETVFEIDETGTIVQGDVGGSVGLGITEADTESNFILQDSSTGELIVLDDGGSPALGARYEGDRNFVFGYGIIDDSSARVYSSSIIDTFDPDYDTNPATLESGSEVGGNVIIGTEISIRSINVLEAYNNFAAGYGATIEGSNLSVSIGGFESFGASRTLLSDTTGSISVGHSQTIEDEDNIYAFGLENTASSEESLVVGFRNEVTSATNETVVIGNNLNVNGNTIGAGRTIIGTYNEDVIDVPFEIGVGENDSNRITGAFIEVNTGTPALTTSSVHLSPSTTSTLNDQGFSGATNSIIINSTGDGSPNQSFLLNSDVGDAGVADSFFYNSSLTNVSSLTFFNNAMFTSSVDGVNATIDFGTFLIKTDIDSSNIDEFRQQNNSTSNVTVFAYNEKQILAYAGGLQRDGSVIIAGKNGGFIGNASNATSISGGTVSDGANSAVAIGNITVSTSNYVGLGGNRIVTNTDLQFTDGTLINDRLDVSSTQNTDGSGYYSVDTSSGDVTLTIQTSENVDGKEINVKNNGSGTVTIETQGSSTVDDSTNATIPTDNNAVTLVYNSTNDDWEIY